MPYVGNKPVNNFVSFAKQNITGNGGTSYSLDYPVTGANDIELFINNVRQEPTEAYSASGATLTLTGAISSTDDVYVIFRGRALQTAQHPADSALEASQATISGTVSIGGDVDISNTSRYYIDTKQTYVIATAMNPSGSSRVVNYVDATDHRFQTGGVDRLSVDAAGRVTMPYQPAFYAYLTSNLGLSGGTSTTITYPNVSFNIGNNYNTSNGRFTAPVSGVYVFTMNVQVSSTSNNPHAGIEVNGSNTIFLDWNASKAANITRAIYLNSGDYVHAQVYVTSNDTLVNAERNTFSGYLLG